MNLPTITTRRSFLAAEALLLTQLAAPARSAATETARPQAVAPEVWVRTELYFGTGKPGGGEVSDAEFNFFVDTEVTRLFPDGLTVLTGRGQFRSASGALIREKSHVLILLYPPQVKDANQKIQEIRERYKAAHHQESVLRGDSFSFISF